MFEKLDQEIARVTAELNKLRQQKLEELKRQMRQLESGEESAPEPKRKYLKLTDDEVKERLSKAVEQAGVAGISAQKAAVQTGILYAKVRLVMPKLFKRTGTGKHTLYSPKRKKQN